jgi:hypothetical protein
MYFLWKVYPFKFHEKVLNIITVTNKNYEQSITFCCICERRFKTIEMVFN